jgi:hypothetical protein
MIPTKFQFIWPSGFQRRLKCEKLTDDRRRTPSDGKSSHCLWQGELINGFLHGKEILTVGTLTFFKVERLKVRI